MPQRGQQNIPPEQWRRVEEIFLAVSDLSPEEREAPLAAECGEDAALLAEVRSLLRYDNSDPGRIEDALQSTAAAVAGSGAHSGTRIGPYRVERLLGHGGMGAVYLASRNDEHYAKQVALKLVPAGLDHGAMLERFRQERQILARLEHPYIARLLDGGATETGAPYFVMEYVRGDPIDKWCEERRLDVRARCELFRKVCDAVSYAHRQLVVHRDLKPGNILVTEDGTPRLLDFGIAKLLPADGGQTYSGRTLALAMTPDYASPEQVRGEAAGTATDVYSLGAVLYRLLSGAKPHTMQTMTPGEIERVICKVAPPRPSSVAPPALRRALRGDLDNIVLMALRKEPERRYHSAEQLSDDLRRYLEGRPVHAREDTLSYRTGKFLKRNGAATAAVLLVAGSLTVGSGVALWQARKAEASRVAAVNDRARAELASRKAEAERQQAMAARADADAERDRAQWNAGRAQAARAVAEQRLQQMIQLANESMVGVYEAIEKLPGGTEARAKVAQATLHYLARLEEEAGGDARVKKILALTYERTGDVLGLPERANLGGSKEALDSFLKARALTLELLKLNPGDSEELARLIGLQHRIAQSLANLSQLRAAMPQYRVGLALARSFTARDAGNPRAWLLRSSLAQAVARGYNQFAPELTIPYVEEQLTALDRLKALKPGDDEVLHELSSAYGTRARIRSRFGRQEEALADYRRSVAIREQLAAAHPADNHVQRNLMLAYGNMADHLGSPLQYNAGDREGAAQAYRKARAIAEKMVAADPSDRTARSDLGAVAMRQGVIEQDDRRALALLGEAAGIAEERLARDAKETNVRLDLGIIYEFTGQHLAHLGELESALASYRKSLAVAESLVAEHAMHSSAQIQMMADYKALIGLRARMGDAAGVAELCGTALAAAERFARGRVDSKAMLRYLGMVPSWEGRAYVELAPARKPDDKAALTYWQRARDAFLRSREGWTKADEMQRARFRAEREEDGRLLERCGAEIGRLQASR